MDTKISSYRPCCTSLSLRTGESRVAAITVAVGVTLLAIGVLALQVHNGTDLGRILNHLGTIGPKGAYAFMGTGALLIVMGVGCYLARKKERAFKSRHRELIQQASNNFQDPRKYQLKGAPIAPGYYTVIQDTNTPEGEQTVVLVLAFNAQTRKVSEKFFLVKVQEETDGPVEEDPGFSAYNDYVTRTLLPHNYDYVAIDQLK